MSFFEVTGERFSNIISDSGVVFHLIKFSWRRPRSYKMSHSIDCACKEMCTNVIDNVVIIT